MKSKFGYGFAASPSYLITKFAFYLIAGTLGLLIGAFHTKQPVALPVQQRFAGTDISSAGYGTGVTLTDHNGNPRTLADFKGRAVVLVFGYTHCPDVCATTLLEMAQVMKLLGVDANRVQVLFATLDPQRDTQAVLAQFVPAFQPGFVGLYGNQVQTATIVRDFHVFYKKQPGNDPSSYTLDHTAGSFVLDPAGRPRLFWNYGMRAEDMAADLRQLLTAVREP
jgi:protein SCO1